MLKAASERQHHQKNRFVNFCTIIYPIIAIDGTFLKGTYRETMFVTTALDENDQIYPMAFSVGNSENDVL